MTAHAQLKALRDKYLRLLVESQRQVVRRDAEPLEVVEAKEIVYSTIIDDIEDALRAHEGE